MAVEVAEGDNCLRVRFEDLLSHPEEVIRRICGFIDLPFDVIATRTAAAWLSRHSAATSTAWSANQSTRRAPTTGGASSAQRRFATSRATRLAHTLLRSHGLPNRVRRPAVPFVDPHPGSLLPRVRALPAAPQASSDDGGARDLGASARCSTDLPASHRLCRRLRLAQPNRPRFDN